ncbi:site-specific integrase [Limimaricola variabilis]|uniref:tyrosine-type recombinase/integrase n=1 Tax=Limimaricola variabilis TaxID=1492771 RepID=UPI002AC9CC33|nr:site-specific integrase [Limimaricola variabilis]WPY93195.1 site-specific integrase [Limimaricola variabilis]
MASIRKHGKGWRAEVARQGVRRSKVFASKAEAKDWAARQEYAIVNADAIRTRAPFRDVLDRYAREVSPGKRGARWETLRLERFKADTIGAIAMDDLKPADFAEWRDRRLREVAPGSVRREMTLLSAVLNVARKEWGMISVNPLSDVRRPSEPPPRDRRPTSEEMERLQISAGTDLTTATGRTFHAFLFSIETGMRAGEVTAMRWRDVDLARRIVRLPMTKNGTSREVPLSAEAVRLLEALPKMDPVFNIANLDPLWRKIRSRAKVEGLNYHDSRHEAITRLARKLDVLALARMVGHKNISQLQSYYNETAEELARRLD